MIRRRFCLITIVFIGLCTAIAVAYAHCARSVYTSQFVNSLPRNDPHTLEATIRRHLASCNWIRLRFSYMSDIPVEYIEIVDDEARQRIADAFTIEDLYDEGIAFTCEPVMIETSDGLLAYFCWAGEAFVVCRYAIDGSLSWDGSVAIRVDSQLRSEIESIIGQLASGLNIEELHE